MHLTRHDCIAACLFGGALGDAIGAHYEGSDPQREFAIPAHLRITDDTQLTLATCEAISETGTVDPASIARHFARWFRERRLTGLGASTLKALTELDAGGHWALVGATGERAAGSGAAMRIAPLAFFLDPDDEDSRRTIRDVGRITHRNDEAYVGALAIVRTLHNVINGAPLDRAVLPPLLHTLPDSRVRDRLAAVHDSRLTVDDYAARFATSGYVVDAIPLAILAAIESPDLIQSIAHLVQLGGDTDTIASLCGQIVGAAHGPRALPLDLIEQIDAVNLISKIAIDLSRIPIPAPRRDRVSSWRSGD